MNKSWPSPINDSDSVPSINQNQLKTKKVAKKLI